MIKVLSTVFKKRLAKTYKMYMNSDYRHSNMNLTPLV